MMKTGVSLAQKEVDWEAALKTYAEKDLERKNVAAFDLTETGGYRNPHHHYYHVPNGSSSARSWHQFGVALDVRGWDIDMVDDGTVGSKADRFAMGRAVKAYAGANWISSNYSDKHVHAQWTGGSSNKERASTTSPFSLPPQGTDTALGVETVPGAPPAPGGSQVSGACGVHTIASTEASKHTEKTGACGHTYYACSQGDHDKLQASCSTNTSCTATNFYLCQHTSHTYAFQSCGHRYDPNSSSAHSHRSVSFPCNNHSYYACAQTTSAEIARHSYGTLPCGAHTGYPCDSVLRHLRMRPCPPDANGILCSIGSYYGCSPHSHSYPSSSDSTAPSTPSTPTLVACGGVSYTGCSGASSRTEHHVPLCSSGCGNGYWTCSSTAVYDHETTFTCRRSGCGETFTRCSNSTCTSDSGTHAYHWAQ